MLEVEGKTINSQLTQTSLVELYDLWDGLPPDWTWVNNNSGISYNIEKGNVSVIFNGNPPHSSSAGGYYGYLLSPNIKTYLADQNIAFFLSTLAGAADQSPGLIIASGGTAYMQITDGGTNTVTLANARTHIVTYGASGLADQYGGCGAAYSFGTFNFELVGNSLTITNSGYHANGVAGVNIRSGWSIGGSAYSESNLIADQTVIDVSTWANIYIKLYAASSMISDSARLVPAYASIQPVITSGSKFGSNKTA